MLNVFVSISYLQAAPVDVDDHGAIIYDDRPVLDAIHPHEEKVVVGKEEGSRLEFEGIPSKVIGTYDNSQNKVADFLNPTPLVDGIEEHEKYGNSGDKFYGAGRALVNTYEGFSNILNKVIDSPMEIAKKISRTITAKLNSLGGTIVGL